MPRVLVVNNYPLQGVWEEVKNGQTPDQYLYGINHFNKRNYEVELVDHLGDPFLDSFQRTYSQLKLPVPIGDLDQQASVLAKSNADLIYAPCQTQTYLLSYMRALGLLKIPMVCVAHQPINPGRLSFVREPFIRLMLQGVDAYPSLSTAVSESINRRVNESAPICWGPDKEFYPFDPSFSIGVSVVAAGRTGRDFQTFGQAASKAGVDAQILCLQSNYDPEFEKFSSNVHITVRPDNDFLPYPELVKIYAQARVLAIPLYSDNHLNGLSSLVDALAMGKPVIMTRNPYIDIDIERLGIGKWVRPGSVDDWIEAIKFFDANPVEAQEMGLRARALVDCGINSESFANQIMDIFDRVLDK